MFTIRYLDMKYLLLLICYVLIPGCSRSVDQMGLIGKWDYVRIENLNAQSEDSTTAEDLKIAKPYIQFTAENKVQIIWDGKVLSSGTYRLDGQMIRYQENLPGGRKREFPFLVNSLSEEKIVFQTMSNENTRVTALKRK